VRPWGCFVDQAKALVTDRAMPPLAGTGDGVQAVNCQTNIAVRLIANASRETIAAHAPHHTLDVSHE
jgi:hypothetical protein